MKIKIIPTLSLSLLLSWQCTAPEQSSAEEKEVILTILVYDQSESFDYAQLKSEEIAKLIATDATAHETWMAVVRITEKNSLEQNLLLVGPLTLDTLTTIGSSIYEQPKILSYNAPIREAYQQRLSSLQEQLEEEVLPVRQLAYSDINGALAYALRLVKQEQFRNAKIRLILYSDLKHDLPGDQTLQSITFPPNVTIYPVMVNHTLNYGTIFPNCQVRPLVGFRASFFSTAVSLK